MGFDGQTTLTAIDAVELGGTLVIEAGSLQLGRSERGCGVRVVLGGYAERELLCWVTTCGRAGVDGCGAVREWG